MRISIEFDSCWQTGFLNGEHDKPVSKINPRKFVATSKTRGEKPTPITKNTVMGILCRLIGDQRKLYQAKNSENYYFADIEDKVTYSFPKIDATSQELMFLTNKSDDRCAQSAFLGVLPSDNPWFFSDVAPKLWSVLFLDKIQLLDFILNEQIEFLEVDCSPTKSLLPRIEAISNTKQETGSVLMTKKRILADQMKTIEKKQKQIENTLQKWKEKPPKTPSQQSKNEEKINKLNEELLELHNELERMEVNTNINALESKIVAVIEFLTEKFPGNEYLNKDIIYPMSLYAAALYLQAERLCNQRNDLRFIRNEKGEISIQGFSKRGFNGVRDWLNPMTGKRKKVVGTPCIVQKQSGSLEIILDICRDKAKKIKQDIDNAGVSSFYLGKKGLAYITHIDTREVKH